MPTSPSLADAIACETDRLRIAALRPLDAAALHAITDDSAVIEAISFLSHPFTLDDARALVEGSGDGRDCFAGVWERGSGDLIGVVGTHLRGTNAVEIGYWIATASAGRGYASEAAGGVIAALMRAYPDREIVAECRPENTASWRVLAKLGFRPSGADGHRTGRKALVLER